MAHIVSLPIEGGGQPKFLHSDDPAVIARWIEAENRPGYGIYDILNPLVPGARTQGRENMRSVLFLFIDVDCKDVEETSAEVERHLRNLALRPTWLNDSGHGFHVIYQLKEEIERGTPEFDRAQAFQEQLIRYLAGDPKVRLWSLLRRPGTTNFKEEPFVQCHTVLTEAPVDPTEMEAFCELVAGAPLLTHKVGPGPRDDGRGEGAPKAPVDVEQRLTDMRWHGAGNSSIDITRNDVMASLLNSGMCLTEAADIILAAIRNCVAGDPAAASWDWRAEYLRTAYNGATLINKDHTLVHLLPDDLRTKFQELDHGGLEPVIKKNAYKLFVYPTATTARGKKATSAPFAHSSEDPAPPKTPRVVLKPFVQIAPALLPCRRFLYGRHYQRGVVSSTIAPGGTGKSSLENVEAVALATARNLLGEQPEERCRVWLHNGEDGREELDRRVIAICQHYGVPQEELPGWLFLTSGTEMPLKIANGYNDLKIDNNLVEEMTRTILDRN